MGHFQYTVAGVTYSRMQGAVRAMRRLGHGDRRPLEDPTDNVAEEIVRRVKLESDLKDLAVRVRRLPLDGNLPWGVEMTTALERSIPDATHVGRVVGQARPAEPRAELDADVLIVLRFIGGLGVVKFKFDPLAKRNVALKRIANNECTWETVRKYVRMGCSHSPKLLGTRERRKAYRLAIHMAELGYKNPITENVLEKIAVDFAKVDLSLDVKRTLDAFREAGKW